MRGYQRREIIMIEASIDEKFLIENYRTMTVSDLARYFGVSRGAVTRRAKKFGLEKEVTFKKEKNEAIRNLEPPLERYSITDKGRVFNRESGRLLTPKINGDGYPQITFQVDGKRYDRLLHRLLGLAFINNPENKPFINHIDGDKQNFKLDNLEWCTPKENAIHASENGLLAVGEDSGTNKITEAQAKMILDDLNNGMKQVDVINKHSFATRSIVQKIQYGTRWKHIS